jgi:signal transduction histidine kinase
MSLDTPRDSAASRLIHSKEKILRQWMENAKKELPSARYQSSPVLRDELPSFLDEIADALDPNTELEIACDKDGSEICREHGEQRAQLSQYSLKEVIQEYMLLKKSLFEVLEKTGPISKEDQSCISDSIETGILEASGEYVRVQDQIRQQFIAILTHDLRNPLTAVKMSAQMIGKRSHDSELVEHFSGRIVENVKRIDNMIRDLLDTSRIRIGETIALQKNPCDLVLIVREVLVEFVTIHGDRFVLKSPEELKGVWSPDGLRRITENILSNAVKYGDVNPIEIHLLKTQHGVEISVHNFGNPISPEDLPNLFAPYKRTGGSAQTEKVSGWGLGLTLVKGMTEAHGGTVSVESSKSAGTTFKVFIPA